MQQETKDPNGDGDKEATLHEVLALFPPGKQYLVSAQYVSTTQFRWPTVNLYCGTEGLCEDSRLHDAVSADAVEYCAKEGWRESFVTYYCRHCRRSVKQYAIKHKLVATQGSNTPSIVGPLIKIGEYPPFGSPLHPRLQKLLGPDHDLLVKARRCEDQGLGIGAAAYYRRIVENQKDRILDEVIRVIKILPGGNADLIIDLEDAKKEYQFDRAIKSIKHTLPEGLLIKGQNPLLLLHNALSKGVHNMRDEDCLAIANSIRAVLTELCERCASLSKDDRELSKAINTLLNPPQATQAQPQVSRPPHPDTVGKEVTPEE
jgi:hypothetical protein